MSVYATKLIMGVVMAVLAATVLGGCRSRAWIGAAPATAVPATATNDPVAIPDLAAPLGPGSTETAGQAEEAETPEMATYNGIPLPSVGGIDQAMGPPPAWLIVGEELINDAGAGAARRDSRRAHDFHTRATRRWARRAALRCDSVRQWRQRDLPLALESLATGRMKAPHLRNHVEPLCCVNP